MASAATLRQCCTRAQSVGPSGRSVAVSVAARPALRLAAPRTQQPRAQRPALAARSIPVSGPGAAAPVDELAGQMTAELMASMHRKIGEALEAKEVRAPCLLPCTPTHAHARAARPMH